jgi:hypothetical protein
MNDLAKILTKYEGMPGKKQVLSTIVLMLDVITS